MNRNLTRLILSLFIMLLLPIAAFANSAEPPSIIIIVNDPHQKVNVSLLSSNDEPEPLIFQAAWERHFKFYRVMLKKDIAPRFLVKTDDSQFEVTLDAPLDTYRNVFTLDVDSKTLTPGTSPVRDGLLIAIRLLLTLLIEGSLFFLLGYREKQSWLVFIGVNLLTQGALNIWLNQYGNWDSYLILTLLFGEFWVFMAESYMITFWVKEKTVGKRFAYVWLANTASLILGGYLIAVLPI